MPYLTQLFTLLLTLLITSANTQAGIDHKKLLLQIRQTLPLLCAQTMTVTHTTADHSAEKVFRYQISQQPAWSLVSVNGSEPDDQKIQSLSQLTTPIAEGSGHLATLLEADFVFHRTIDHLLIYRAADLVDNTVTIDGVDLSKRMHAEIAINVSGNTPFIDEVFIKNKRPFRNGLFTRITNVSEIRRYSMQNRQLQLTEVDIDLASNTFGKKQRQRETRRFSAIDCSHQDSLNQPVSSSTYLPALYPVFQ